MKTPVFIVDFEHISQLILVFLMLGKCRLDGHWAIFSDLPMSGKDNCHVKEIILVSVFACEEKVSHHGRWNKYFFVLSICISKAI